MLQGEEEISTQEGAYSQSQNELTQLCEASEDITPSVCDERTISPLTLPWGRLIPCSRNNEALAVPADRNENNVETYEGNLLPRRPAEDSRISPGQLHTVKYLGLEGLLASDRFNEYIIGRSQKCDFVSLKLHKAKGGKIDPDTAKSLDWVHSMVSNRHFRIFCMLKNLTNRVGMGGGQVSGTTGMDVFLEDSSGNGTLVNNTILLRRGEKRLLHTGDEICLINPATLRKRIPSLDLQRNILEHYSYIFVNVHQQQGGGQIRHIAQSPAYQLSTKRKGFVDVKATTANSPPQKNAKLIMGPPSTSPKSKHRQAGDSGSPLNAKKRVRRQHFTTNKSLGSHIPQPRRIEEHYDLRDLIGSGTYGEVRRAIHRQTGEQMAVKIIDMSANGRNYTTARRIETERTLKAEASILQSLDHPYIVKCIDLFVSHTAIYLVMEMLHGGDLFDRIVEKGRYTETESRRVMRRLLSAVYYLHEERDVVHRDLKPENILCDNRSSDIDIKLTDFGLAKNVTEDGLKTFCGTPLYFAPEVLLRRDTIAGRGRYGKEADMWSLGIILYILLCGAPPFDSDAYLNSTANAKIRFKSQKWATISSEAKEFILLLLTANPSNRINIREACKHKWILKNDGDTHTHPLLDPLLSKNKVKENALFGTVMSNIPSKKKKRTEILQKQSNEDRDENNNDISVGFEPQSTPESKTHGKTQIVLESSDASKRKFINENPINRRLFEEPKSELKIFESDNRGAITSNKSENISTVMVKDAKASEENLHVDSNEKAYEKEIDSGFKASANMKSADKNAQREIAPKIPQSSGEKDTSNEEAANSAASGDEVLSGGQTTLSNWLRKK